MFPPRTVLAAVDFSDSSRVALTFAARFAKHVGAVLHMLYAEDPMLVAAAAARGVDLTRETNDELVIFAKSVGLVGAARPVVHVVTGPPSQVIRDIGRREGADLVVVGMRGISAAEHLMFGSTTEGVLRAADISVVAVPDAWTPPDPVAQDLTGLGPVVAAVEFSESSIHSAAIACRLAAALHTTIEAIHVIPSMRVLNRWQAHANAVIAQREGTARLDLERALLGLDVEMPIPLRVQSGNIAETVAAAVAGTKDRHPMLVIGRRAQAPGATAHRILTLSTAPVLQYALSSD
jgi:nucleotide-binding universal stress UspA family protein